MEKDKEKGKKINMQALPDSTSVRFISFEKGNAFDKIANTWLCVIVSNESSLIKIFLPQGGVLKPLHFVFKIICQFQGL